MRVAGLSSRVGALPGVDGRLRLGSGCRQSSGLEAVDKIMPKVVDKIKPYVGGGLRASEEVFAGAERLGSWIILGVIDLQFVNRVCSLEAKLLGRRCERLGRV